MITELRNLPAPAKLNLFLHVTGRRPDGYHLLETAFELIDLCDRIDLVKRDDGRIEMVNASDEVNPITIDPEQNLAVRAARALKRSSETVPGVSIRLRKLIPIGGGLGGGSSDAATVLMGLNRLWDLGLPTARLAKIGVSLGADVPIFIFGRSAFGNGIGDRLRPIPLPIRQYLVLQPDVSVPTEQIFRSPELTRNSKPLKIDGFSPSWPRCGIVDRAIVDRAIRIGRNDLQAVAEKLYPRVRAALEDLRQAASVCGVDPALVRMSGSGACIFVPLDDERTGLNLMDQLSRKKVEIQTGEIRTGGARTGEARTGEARAWVVNSLPLHPLVGSKSGRRRYADRQDESQFVE